MAHLMRVTDGVYQPLHDEYLMQVEFAASRGPKNTRQSLAVKKGWQKRKRATPKANGFKPAKAVVNNLNKLGKLDTFRHYFGRNIHGYTCGKSQIKGVAKDKTGTRQISGRVVGYTMVGTRPLMFVLGSYKTTSGDRKGTTVKNRTFSVWADLMPDRRKKK